jgi:hypothetical protein
MGSDDTDDIVEQVAAVTSAVVTGALMAYGLFQWCRHKFNRSGYINLDKKYSYHSDELIAAIKHFSTEFQVASAAYQQQADEITRIFKKRAEEQCSPLTEAQNHLLQAWRQSSNALLAHCRDKPEIPENISQRIEAELTTKELNEYVGTLDTLSRTNVENYVALSRSLTSSAPALLALVIRR